jgi:uncharacterized protein (AIM24 family)
MGGEKIPTLIRGQTVNTPGLSLFDPLNELPASYTVTGVRNPILTRSLQAGEAMKGEPGSMLIMGDNIKMKSGLMGKGIGGMIKAGVGGELFKNTYRNGGGAPEQISLAGNTPFGQLVGINLDANGGSFIATPGAYFASDENVKVSAKFLRASNMTACCCGGMPPIVQSIKGSGMAYILGSGTVVTKTLGAGEKVLVSTDGLLGFSESVKFDVRQVGSCMTCCFGGEGCFNTLIEGPGVLYMQSFSTQKLLALMPPQGNKNGGEGGGAGAPAVAATMDR